MNAAVALPLLVAIAFACWVACGGVRALLLHHRVLDRPNARSLHETPVPRGGGLALVPIALLAWTMLSLFLGVPEGFWLLLLGTLLLMAISWLDDIESRPAAVRLALQVVAVVIGLAALPDSLLFQGLLPPLLDRVVTALLWIWFVNLFNFMDGIDGISGVETVSLGLGLALVAWLGSGASATLGAPVLLPLVLTAAALGFLAWNWAPARLFLGDAGSVPLGYLLGWLLLSAAAAGAWAPALILPLYYLADSGVTLVRRILQRRKVWEAHREHFYQRAAGGGLGHAAVARRILLANLALIALALLAAQGQVAIALVLAVATVALLLAHLGRDR